MASKAADDKGVGGVLVDVDDMDSNCNQNGCIDGGSCPETQNTTVAAATDSRTNDTPPDSGTKAEKTNKCCAQCPMEEVEKQNGHEGLRCKHEHRDRKENGRSDEAQDTTGASKGWSTWRQVWTKLVLLIINQWMATWKQKQGDKGTTTSCNRTSYRVNNDVGIGTSDGNGKWDTTMMSPTDTHKCEVAKARGDIRAPKRDDAETEHQHKTMCMEAAKEDTRKYGASRRTRNMSDKQEAASVQQDAGKTEQCKVVGDKGNISDGISPMKEEEATETRVGWPCKHALENNDECGKKELQMAATCDYMDNMDGVDNDCNQTGDIDGRLCTETQKSMVDIEGRGKVTPQVRATQVEKLYGNCAQSCMEETEMHSSHVAPWAKPAEECFDARWLAHKTQVTTWAF